MGRVSLPAKCASIACAMLFATAVGGAAMNAEPASAQSGGPAFKVVAKNLNNPRGLTMGPLGALYVAEAGKGDRTGAVVRANKGKQVRVAKNLPSVAGPGGEEASGPHDVAIAGKGKNQSILVAVGGGPREETGDGRFGRILRVKDGKVRKGADLAVYEQQNNPDGREIDSNPYSLVVDDGKRLVVDAAANALLETGSEGISTLATFPVREVEFMGDTVEMESVPDALAVGPDGAYYVGELTGFPFPRGEARVYRVEPGEEPEVFEEGFTNIIDIAFGPGGNLFVLELAKDGLLSEDLTGRLVKVKADGSRSVIAEEELTAPTGVFVGPKGAIYVSNNGLSAGGGEVIRISQRR